MWRLLKGLFSSQTSNEPAPPGVVRHSATLAPTAEGAAVSATGRADMSCEGSWQRLLVQVSALLEDGAVLHVVINGRPTATIVLLEREGDFEVGSTEGTSLAPGLSDVRAVSDVAITAADGTVLLVGSFRRSFQP